MGDVRVVFESKLRGAWGNRWDSKLGPIMHYNFAHFFISLILAVLCTNHIQVQLRFILRPWTKFKWLDLFREFKTWSFYVFMFKTHAHNGFLCKTTRTLKQWICVLLSKTGMNVILIFGDPLLSCSLFYKSCSPLFTLFYWSSFCVIDYEAVVCVCQGAASLTTFFSYIFQTILSPTSHW